MAETVLVTGGSGYIAGYCIAELLRRGHRVNATVRSLTREPEVRVAVGADLSADAGWREAAAGVDYVLHVASPFTAQTGSEADFVVPARDGALRVVRAGLEAGARRIVMTSSTQATTYPKEPNPRPRDESCFTDPTRPDVSYYGRSKVIAETLRRELGPQARKVPTREIPGFVVQAMALVDAEVRSIAKDVGKRRENTSAKARERLGWSPRTPEESVVDCARSLIAEGVV